MFDWISEANRLIDEGERVGPGPLRDMLWSLGLETLMDEPAGEAGEAALAKLREREDARARKDFAAADAARDELAELGWEVRDTPGGPQLVRLG
jgi:cysteinyl-tRNA synthetase